MATDTAYGVVNNTPSPNNAKTTFIFYHDIPLDNSYTNTIFFPTIDMQRQYFYQHQKYFIGDTGNPDTTQFQSYTRISQNTENGITSGKVRVTVGNYEGLSECNYMCIINARGDVYDTLEARRYCFITKVEYVSQNVCNVYYELDVMQTYLFSYTPEECYVLRNHTTTDKPYENLEPEDIPVTRTIMAQRRFISLTESTANGRSYINALCTEEIGEGESIFNNAAGIVCPFYIYSVQVPNVYEPSSYDNFNSFMNTIKEHPNAVITLVQTPRPINEFPISNSYSYAGFTYNTSIDGYNFHNNKLLNSPFQKIIVKATDGNSREYSPELFSSSTPNAELGNINFNVLQIPAPNYTSILYPDIDSYGTYTGIGVGMLDYSVVCNSAIFTGFTADTYASFTERHGLTTAVSLIGDVANIATGKPVSGTLGLLGTLAAPLQAQMTPDYYKGNIPSTDLQFAQSGVGLGFNIELYTITAEQAEAVDAFFDRYGYAINRLVVPSRQARKTWTYVLTADFNYRFNDGGGTYYIKPTVQEMNKIGEIHKKGITYWRAFTNSAGNVEALVGQYNNDNGVITSDL